MWNGTDTPLAILFTFRTYGTWLHGDERGAVNRFNNIYGTPTLPGNEDWKKYNESLLSAPPVLLDHARRGSVEKAIRETCLKRSFGLHAVNIRTNHAHSVISIGENPPDRILGALKANATRQMREDGCWIEGRTPWAHKGSCRRLWNERSVSEAVDYVINRQGADLKQYDWW